MYVSMDDGGGKDEEEEERKSGYQCSSIESGTGGGEFSGTNHHANLPGAVRDGMVEM